MKNSLIQSRRSLQMICRVTLSNDIENPSEPGILSSVEFHIASLISYRENGCSKSLFSIEDRVLNSTPSRPGHERDGYLNLSLKWLKTKSVISTTSIIRELLSLKATIMLRVYLVLKKE